jgi:hypothetical protein
MSTIPTDAGAVQILQPDSDNFKGASNEQIDKFDTWAADLRGYTDPFTQTSQSQYIYNPYRALNGLPAPPYNPPPVHSHYWSKIRRDFFWVRITGSAIPNVWPSVLISMAWCALMAALDISIIPDFDISPPNGTVIGG